jgi:glycosyltransferase involved in cell wall biosynthesis
MRWLIVEDALRDRKGHWLEAVGTFRNEFSASGDHVTVLTDAELAPDIRDALRAEAILPRSVWHRLGDGSGRMTRYTRVFSHNWQTWRVMKRYLEKHQDFDAIFVPTVSVHHLLAWTRLIKRTLCGRRTRVLLFFVYGPLRANPSGGTPVLEGSPTARMMIWLLKSLAAEVKRGKVVLGVETEAMKAGMERAAGVPFVCFPPPVSLANGSLATSLEPGSSINMACYGPARAEKGSDVLQEAIKRHRRQYPTSHTHFTIQWNEDFSVNGSLVSKSAELMADPQVRFVIHYTTAEEYARQLTKTDVLLLPYRLSSYAFRGSRVIVEAVNHGIPVVTTKGTTLAALAADFGAGFTCEDGSPDSLASAIREMELRFWELKQTAESRQPVAEKYFSVAAWRDRFIRALAEENLVPLECAR